MHQEIFNLNLNLKKMKKNAFSFLVFSISALLCVVACKQNLLSSKQETKGKIQTLNAASLLQNGIEIPKGTQWHYTRENQSEIQITLPEGYAFLLYDHDENTFSISTETDYSCTCDGNGSCIVVYNSDLGFGCLQGSCDRQCIGKYVGKPKKNKKTVEGVLYIANDMLDAQTQAKASLTEFGKKGIFQLDSFRNEIKRTYDLIYKYVEKPNFDNPSDRYVFAICYLYGYEVGIIVPKDENLRKYFPNLQLKDTNDKPKSCSCTEGSGTCKLEKTGLLGYVAYYCTGCKDCTMHF